MEASTSTVKACRSFLVTVLTLLKWSGIILETFKSLVEISQQESHRGEEHDHRE